MKDVDYSLNKNKYSLYFDELTNQHVKNVLNKKFPSGKIVGAKKMLFTELKTPINGEMLTIPNEAKESATKQRLGKNPKYSKHLKRNLAGKINPKKDKQYFQEHAKKGVFNKNGAEGMVNIDSAQKAILDKNTRIYSVGGKPQYDINSGEFGLKVSEQNLEYNNDGFSGTIWIPNGGKYPAKNVNFIGSAYINGGNHKPIKYNTQNLNRQKTDFKNGKFSKPSEYNNFKNTIEKAKMDIGFKTDVLSLIRGGK